MTLEERFAWLAGREAVIAMMQRTALLYRHAADPKLPASRPELREVFLNRAMTLEAEVRRAMLLEPPR